MAVAAATPSSVAAYAARDWLRQDGRWALWLPLPVLFWHQTEEWVVPGGFLPWFNREMAGGDADEFPITRGLGFGINVGLGWALALAAALFGRKMSVLPAMVLSMLVTNAAMHGSAAARDRRYNPGAATGVLVLAPVGLLGLVRLLRDPELCNKRIALGVAGGIVASAAMFVVMRVRVRRDA